MARDTVDPTVGKHGEEHPAWGLISAHRSTGSHGTVLFDSEIRHRNTVTVRIATASRKRELSHDWLYREEEFVDVEMSEAQWASFVSSMNSGSGVPCTIRRREQDWNIPTFPFAPRLEESLNEVRTAGTRAVERIRAAFVAYDEKRNAANLRSLRSAIDGLPANMEFAAESLSKHAEGAVERMRADIEAMVLAHAAHLGLGAADVAELMPGEAER